MSSVDSVAVSMNNKQVERKQTGCMICLPGHHDCSGKRKEFGASQRPASENAMAPHSSTLAWRIQWTEKPGGLQSMGSRRVRHDMT